MHSLYKFFFFVLAASILLSCEQKRDNGPEYLSRLVKENASFVRDTSSYSMVVNTSVHDSAFREETVPVEQGGFAEYFASRHQKNSPETKIFYAYSDSISPFVKGRSQKSAFIDLVALAYARHYAMEISPDDIWLLILDGFRLHVKSNSDSLKDRFVGPNVDTSIKYQKASGKTAKFADFLGQNATYLRNRSTIGTFLTPIRPGYRVNYGRLAGTDDYVAINETWGVFANDLSAVKGIRDQSAHVGDEERIGVAELHELKYILFKKELLKNILVLTKNI